MKMNIRSVKTFLLLLVCFMALSLQNAHAQKVNTDSLRAARQQAIDEMRIAQKRSLDSARDARLRITDSLKAARKQVSDSLAAIRNHRSSKKYKDSLANARQGRIDSIRDVRTAYFDSLKTERQRVIDSTTASRKQTIDSIRAVQKSRSDSLAIIRKYRSSKRFTDSVAIARTNRLDSLKAERQAYNDSVFRERKGVTDSIAAVRKHVLDSTTAVRTKYLDSLKAVRKVRSDSLAKAKESRERLNKSQENIKKEKLQLAFELKIKKKHEAWSNEKLLKKKWSWPRQVIQNTFTRYNYYFNADRKMDEALVNMQRTNRDNYDSLIALYPFNPDLDSTLLAPDMDSIIQKASLGIQIHDPRTKWGDDLYLLLGQAYYYKGNYTDAQAAFRYIISIDQQNKLKALRNSKSNKGKITKEEANSIVSKEDEKLLDFLKHRSVHNEAIVWLSRVYTQSGKIAEAESILELLDNEKDLPESIKGKVALEKAYLNLRKEDYASAAPQLAIAADDKNIPDWLRQRSAYLNAQIQFNRGNYKEAAAQYADVIDLNPKIEMDFYARKNMAYSLVEQGGNQEGATASLKKLLKDNKYAPYHEQVYYVLGRLAANSNKPEDAISYLQKSVASAKSTKKQKALSFASLGNVYYATGNYPYAKLAYDSAAMLSKYAPDDSLILTASKRSKVLDQVSIPTAIIRQQDSLLKLGSLSEKERIAAVRKYIRQVEQQQADSAFAAENPTTKAVQEPDKNEPLGTAGNWYFSNPALIQQGAIDFKRKWGSRQNVDNWRRAGASGNVANRNGGANDPLEETETNTTAENGLSEATLLSFIPATTDQQNTATKKIQKAYVDLGNAYLTALEDYPRATSAVDTLDRKYQAHNYKAEALYIRYQIALKQNKLTEAQQLGSKLRNDYPDSKWAKQIAPQNDKNVLVASAVPVANFYDETYGLMMQREYGNVLQRVRQGQQQYSDPVYLKRFRIMEAIALAGSGNYNQADTLLTQFISTHPNDSLKTWAETVLNYVNKNKPVETVAPPKDSTTAAVVKMPPASVANTPAAFANSPFLDSAKAAAAKANPPVANTPATVPNLPAVLNAGSTTKPPAAYKYEPNEQHYVIFSFPKLESKALGVKAGIKDFNTFKYSSQNLDASLEMLQPDQGIITVKAFSSASHAKIYLNSVKANAQLFREYKSGDYQLFLISAPNFLKLTTDKGVPNYLKFYRANYK